MDENLGRRRRAVPRVEAIVEEELLTFIDWVRTLEVTPTLRARRARFESVRAISPASAPAGSITFVPPLAAITSLGQ